MKNVEDEDEKEDEDDLKGNDNYTRREFSPPRQGLENRYIATSLQGLFLRGILSFENATCSFLIRYIATRDGEV